MVRIGCEHFAIELRSVDEAVEEPSLRLVPEGAPGLLGVFALRGQMLALFSPGRILGTKSDNDTPSTALVMRAGNRRIGIAVDEAEDVVRFDLSKLREAPAQETSDGILLGLLWRDRDLIGLLDSRALISACLSIPVPSFT